MIHAGVDIGKKGLDVCLSRPGEDPRKWPVHKMPYDIQGWDAELRALVPPGAVVVMEPTGYYYMQPLVSALAGHNCVLWQVPTPSTQAIRSVHIAGGKSDAMDARALALAATWIANNRPVRGSYPHDAQREINTHELRLQVNRLHSLKRERTRLLNQLDQIGHSIWPSLVLKKETWLKCLALGALTPSDIKNLAADADATRPDGFTHGNARRPLKWLAGSLPEDLIVPVQTVVTLREINQRREELDAQVINAEERITVTVASPQFAVFSHLWSSVPGASDVAIAALLVATRGRPDTYSRDEFKTALGVAPQRKRSGGSDVRDKNRPGYRPAMVATWFWTMRLLTDTTENNPVQRYHAKLAAQKHQYAFRAAQNKFARLLHGIITNGELYNDHA